MTEEMCNSARCCNTHPSARLPISLRLMHLQFHALTGTLFLSILPMCSSHLLLPSFVLSSKLNTPNSFLIPSFLNLFSLVQALRINGLYSLDSLVSLLQFHISLPCMMFRTDMILYNFISVSFLVLFFKYR